MNFILILLLVLWASPALSAPLQPQFGSSTGGIDTSANLGGTLSPYANSTLSSAVNCSSGAITDSSINLTNPFSFDSTGGTAMICDNVGHCNNFTYTGITGMVMGGISNQPNGQLLSCVGSYLTPGSRVYSNTSATNLALRLNVLQGAAQRIEHVIGQGEASISTLGVSTLAGVVSLIGTSGLFEVTIDSVLNYGSVVTVPQNITLKFTSSGRLDCSSVGGSVTILGPIKAPPQQIFMNCPSGSISLFGNQQQLEVLPQWWGAIPDGTTLNRPQIQAAITAINNTGISLRFPQGTYLVDPDPSTLRALTITGPNIHLRGEFLGTSTIKIKDSAGNYKSILGASPGVDVSRLIVEGLTFDGNGTNNPVTAESDLTTGQKWRNPIFADTGTNIKIRQNRFINVRARQVIRLLGASTGADILNPEIIDNSFENIGGDTSAYYDSSALYVVATGCKVLDNTLTGIAGTFGAVSAIEAHCSNGIVAHNTILNFYAGIIPAGTFVSVYNLQVSNNVIRDVVDGIDIFVGRSGTGTLNGIQNLTVSNNSIILNRDLWVPLARPTVPKGIITESADDLNASNIKISGNNIFVVPNILANSDTADGTGSCFVIRGPNTNSGVKYHLVSIENNTCSNPAGPGVYLSLDVEQLKINDNFFYDTVQSSTVIPANLRRAIYMDGHVKDVEISRNQIVDDQNPALIETAGIRAVFASLTNGQMLDNTIRVSTTSGFQLLEITNNNDPFFLRSNLSSFTPFSSNLKVGSTVYEESTGMTWTQMVEPVGATWVSNKGPSTQTIAAGNIVAADACWSMKPISSAGTVTTSLVDTFTAPSITNQGCVMSVCNVGTNSITLDNNAHFHSLSGADVVLGAKDCVGVGSMGALGYWIQVSLLVDNN